VLDNFLDPVFRITFRSLSAATLMSILPKADVGVEMAENE
jgi:hypothetical protein